VKKNKDSIRRIIRKLIFNTCAQQSQAQKLLV